MAAIGIPAGDGDGGTPLDWDRREVQVSRAIIGTARQAVLVTDPSRFTRRVPVRVARLEETDVVMTDAPSGPGPAPTRRRPGVMPGRAHLHVRFARGSVRNESRRDLERACAGRTSTASMSESSSHGLAIRGGVPGDGG